MAGSTSGGISDLAFVMNMRIDESSVTDSMRTLGDMKSKMSTTTFSAIDSGGSKSPQDIADTKFAEAQQYVAQLDAAYEASEQQRLDAIQAQEDANEAAFAAMLQHVAQLDAAQESSEQQRIAAELAQDEAEETAFAAMLDHVAKLDAAEEAAEEQRAAASKRIMDASRKEAETVRGDLNRAHVRVMDTMDRINHEYNERMKAISAIIGLTKDETLALHAQNDVIRAGNIAVEQKRGNLKGGAFGARFGGGIQEFGRGFEDFTIGFSMAKTTSEGIAMGLRGSANNMAQMASYAGPLAGAFAGVGASLAVIIIPKMIEWLMATKDITEETKKAGDAQIRAAKEIAEFRSGLAKQDKDGAGGGKESLDKQKEKRLGIEREASELRRSLADAENTLQQRRGKDEVDAYERAIEMKGGFTAGKAAERLKMGLAMVVGGTGVAESADTTIAKESVDKIRKELKEKEESFVESKRTEKEIEARFSKELASEKLLTNDAMNAEIRAKDEKEAETIMARLDKKKDKAEPDALKRIEEEYREEKEKIDALRIHEDSAAKLNATNRDVRDAALAKERDKRNKASAIKEIDAKLQANSDQQDALQEQMEKSGNAAGPSAAMVSGTQAAESAINRALSGTQSVEGTMKSQLKELQKIHKSLEAQKKVKTVSL